MVERRNVSNNGVQKLRWFYIVGNKVSKPYPTKEKAQDALYAYLRNKSKFQMM